MISGYGDVKFVTRRFAGRLRDKAALHPHPEIRLSSSDHWALGDVKLISGATTDDVMVAWKTWVQKASGHPVQESPWASLADFVSGRP